MGVNDFRHKSMGTELTQAEYQEEGSGHQWNGQATGDMLYANSATNQRRLAIGAVDDFLQVKGGIPAWRTLAQVHEDIIRGFAKFQWTQFRAADFSLSAVTGSGSAPTPTARIVEIGTGATASSTARRSVATAFSTGYNQGGSSRIVNFSKRIVLALVFGSTEGTTNGKAYIVFGRADADTGALTRLGIGIRIDNQALKGVVHNGTIETTVDLATTLVADRTTIIICISDGAGNATWYNAALASLGTTAAGPTGNSGNEAHATHLYIENNADALQQLLRFNLALLGVEQ